MEVLKNVHQVSEDKTYRLPQFCFYQVYLFREISIKKIKDSGIILVSDLFKTMNLTKGLLNMYQYATYYYNLALLVFDFFTIRQMMVFCENLFSTCYEMSHVRCGLNVKQEYHMWSGRDFVHVRSQNTFVVSVSHLVYRCEAW